MRIRVYAVCLVVLMVLSACGGGSESSADASGDGGSAAGSAEGSSASVGGGGGNTVAFEATALSTDPLAAVHLQIADRNAARPPPAVEPVIDTCGALATADFDTIVNEVAAEYSFGRDATFEASPFGAACEYRSDTHLIRLLVGSADEVSTDADSPGMWLPPGGGDVSETAWVDDGSVTILSEDSFAVETPFAAFTPAGPYGVMVVNTGGTGIDDSFEGVLFARLAAAAAANTAAAAAPSAEAISQLDLVAGDPCSVWSVDDLSGFFTDNTIVSRGDLSTTHGGCEWTSELGDAYIALNLVPLDEELDPVWVPVASGSSVLDAPTSGINYVVTADYAVKVGVRVQDPETYEYRGSDDATLALAENIAARTG